MKVFHSLAVLVAVLALGGCSSVTVKDIQRPGVGTEVTARPSQLVVVPFTVDPQRVKENPMRKNPGQLGNEAQQLVTNYLATELKKLGLPVSMATTGAPPRDAWIVSGQITRLEEGNRLLRMSMGLGMGGTKMETAVQVHSGRGVCLHFNTTGGSNAMPGAVTTPVPFTGLPAALSGAKDGVTDDAARTARMITAAIGQELVQRGWLDRCPTKIKVAAQVAR